MIGYAFCGSFCTHARSIEALERIVHAGYEVQPIMSEVAYSTDTRFFAAQELRRRVCEITGREIIHTVKDAEPLGPKMPLEALIIAPCTQGITDTPVTMAAKAHLRQDRPILIALASNDAMSQNLGNIAKLITRRSVYFVPMEQDDPGGKPHSLVWDFSRFLESFDAMLRGKEVRPLFV